MQLRSDAQPLKDAAGVALRLPAPQLGILLLQDIDYGKIKMYVGNYDFWYESSQLVQQLIKSQNKRNDLGIGGELPQPLYQVVVTVLKIPGVVLGEVGEGGRSPPTIWTWSPSPR